MRLNWLRRNVLWMDGSAGVLVGIVILVAGGWLAEWFELPRGFLRFTGAVNLLYGVYSLTLASRDRRPRALVTTLVAANATWAVLCVVYVVYFRDSASPWGLAHFSAEGLFVAGLAVLEWRWRDALSTNGPL